MTSRKHKNWRRGTGAAYQWLLSHAAHEGDDCLFWPFSRDQGGYGQFGLNRRLFRAHRFMCELVNGPPPTPGHEAAHSCGRGGEGCTNPKHLSWKTRSANQLDRRQHGTKAPSGYRWRPKLTAETVREIRALEGKMTIASMIEKFGVSHATILDVHRRITWKHVA